MTKSYSSRFAECTLIAYFTHWAICLSVMPAFTHRAPITLAIDSSLVPTCSLPTRKRISNCGTLKSLMLLLRSQQAAGGLRNQTCLFPSGEGLHHGHVLHLAVPRATDQINVHVVPFGGPGDGVCRQPAPARRPERFLAVHAHPGGRMKPTLHPRQAAPFDLRKAGAFIAPPVVRLQPFFREGIPDHLVQIAQNVRHRAHGIVVIHQPDGLSKTAGCSCGPNHAVTRVGWCDYLFSHSFPSGSSGRTRRGPGARSSQSGGSTPVPRRKPFEFSLRDFRLLLPAGKCRPGLGALGISCPRMRPAGLRRRRRGAACSLRHSAHRR